jgi:hypothetical protein
MIFNSILPSPTIVRDLMSRGRKQQQERHLTIEDVLAEELRREMGLNKSGRLSTLYIGSDEWDDVMHSVYTLPIEYEGYSKKVVEMKMIKEMIDILSKGSYENVKRSESRKKQMREFVKTMHMYYNLVFTRKGEKVGYGALVYFPELGKEEPDRSSGIVLMAKHTVKDGNNDIKFEKAKFDDFLIEVKPFIDLLGNLYRKSRRI